MSITPLDLGAWGAIYCGFTLVRSSMADAPRDVSRLGPGRKRALTGYVLIAAGMLILLAVMVRHIARVG